MDVDRKSHRKPSAGPAAEKKKSKFTKNKQQNNPKAFAPNSGRNAEKMGRRREELIQKKLHVPQVDRTVEIPPPIIIGVVGPPGTGKTTLIRSLVKRYTKHNLNEIHGPITVVAGKQKRFTFIECNNDINSMVDIGKIADLVLLTIDASYGFEMETFEFLNILQTHGFPKVMGILTHLDRFKDSKRLRKTKKVLKQRFWTEIYQGAKLFYLSGMMNGKYPKTEIMNLSRFMSVMKFRPLIWRNTHSYMLADRVEDLTNPEQVSLNPKIDRTITLYGYLHGTSLKPDTKVHVPGVGDIKVDNISILPDPCALPDKQRKLLNEKHKLLYAPMSDVGGIIHDKDAIYITVPGNFNKNADDGGEGEKMVMELQESKNTLYDQVQSSEMRLFNESVPRKASEFQDYYSESDEEEDFEKTLQEEDDDDDVSDGELESDHEMDEENNKGRTRRKVKIPFNTAHPQSDDENVEFADSDSDFGNGGEDEFGDELDVEGDQELVGIAPDGALRWKSKLLEQAKEKFMANQKLNLMDLVYNTDFMPHLVDDESEEEEEGGLFTVLKKKGSKKSLAFVDTCKFEICNDDIAQWDDEEVN